MDVWCARARTGPGTVRRQLQSRRLMLNGHCRTGGLAVRRR
ncbi:hypothetical protein PPTG_17216 [Phytophthora nicotianae INRA-310]|uniref:Uncharacterized protein n=1 Tax=Phytophthora nicotianae (strain INRA-310) TaxID=761204 RepID=W2PN77_PHYN3|nr:hypothetical protein PPTG_17216 [Phytophthora nicotianae INRA-310]ETN01485.1 hypothetical protein PPTG_17216 [Phytophthora nicotianae INRA-310]